MIMQNVTVFGGAGFIGSYIVRELAKSQYNIKVVSRNVEKAAELRLCGNLGQVVPVYGDSKSDIEKHIKSSDIVINAIGTLHGEFDYVHHRIPESIARIAKENNVKKLVHFSALTNDATEYGRSKIQGEEAVKREFGEAIIIKPSVVFGEEDNFFNLFAKIARKFRFLPLINGGKTIVQPVYVADIARFVSAVANNEDIKKRTFTLVGPTKYSMKELMVFIKDALGIKCLLAPIPNSIAMIEAWLLEFKILAPINKFITGSTDPILTRDQVKMLNYDNFSDEKAFSEFGIEPKSIEEIVPIYLSAFYS